MFPAMKKLHRWILFGQIFGITVAAVSGGGGMATWAASAPPSLKACVLCHTESGVSPTPNYPNLAAQRASYLVDQLKAIRDKRRNTPDSVNYMRPVVSRLSEQDMTELADYYSALPPATGNPPKPDLVPIGQELYYRGSVERGVPACATCHGLDGAGTRTGPRIASQHADYLARQLKWFRDGKRAEGAAMPQVAKSMTDADIEAVSNFAESL